MEGGLRVFVAVIIGLGIAAVVAIWLLVARSRFIQEDDVEQSSRVGQLYGYAVCLIAVLIWVFTVKGIIGDAITLASPGSALQGSYYQPSLTSFDSYVATRDRERWMDPTRAADRGSQPDTVSGAALRARYEALRADRLTYARDDAVRSLVASVVLLVLAIVLFLVHWQWLGRAPAQPRRVGQS